MVPIKMANKIYKEKREDGDVIFPSHRFVMNWVFKNDDEVEALLANSIAENCEKNGLGPNDVMYIVPLVLRMVKSKSGWAK